LIIILYAFLINFLLIILIYEHIIEIHSFPWTLEISNFESFTLQGNLQRNFIKKVCFKATFDLTVKDSFPDSMKNQLSALSLCLYIDTSPIIISMSEEQVSLINNHLL
jgi:vacuolar protein sorting-associated protein 13B